MGREWGGSGLHDRVEMFGQQARSSCSLGTGHLGLAEGETRSQLADVIETARWRRGCSSLGRRVAVCHVKGFADLWHWILPLPLLPGTRGESYLGPETGPGMPGTVREGAKEGDPCINPGRLGWKIKQRGGIKMVRVGSVHSLTPSVAVHQAPSLRKASSCPATPGGQARQRGEPPLSVLDRPGFKSQFWYFTY